MGQVCMIIVKVLQLQNRQSHFQRKRVCYSFVLVVGYDGLSAFM